MVVFVRESMLNLILLIVEERTFINTPVPSIEGSLI